MTITIDSKRHYWLWVTRPEYYLDEQQNEREDLDPSNNNDTEGWWTCHKDTCKGDLALLWRTTPKRDIGYLIQASSDAYALEDDVYAVEQGWDYGCDYQVLYKFPHPVTIQDLHNRPEFQEWGTYKGQFRRRVSRIPNSVWLNLNQLIILKNSEYRSFFETIQHLSLFPRILREEQLEEELARNLAILKPFGYDLELFEDPITGASGRQFVCRGNGGRIDLLCYDRSQQHYVVIELKNVYANERTFGQICNYIGWVQERIANDRPVLGLVISRGASPRFVSSSLVTDRVFHINLTELGFQ